MFQTSLYGIKNVQLASHDGAPQLPHHGKSTGATVLISAINPPASDAHFYAGS